MITQEARPGPRFVYTERNPSEQAQKRSFQQFANWQPPFEFKGHWVFASGGGMAVVEADSAAAFVEATAPFTPFFEFTIEPVASIEEGVPIFTKTNAWRDSISSADSRPPRRPCVDS